MRRILEEELGLTAYLRIVKPLLSDNHVLQRKKFANWNRTDFRKQDTLRILFSNEKYFDVDDIYNFQNHFIWTASLADADKKSGVESVRKFPEKRMV